MKKCIAPNDAYRIRTALKGKNIIFVGMMGSGKSAIGKRLAANLDIPFVDADSEIEQAAGMSIPDIFECFGEEYFRSGERKVIARLMENDPIVLSTGGGAFMNEQTRKLFAQQAVTVWLKANFETLMERVQRKDNRPLLKTDNPQLTMQKLMAEREPVYALADVTVESRNETHETVVEAVVEALLSHFEAVA